MVPNNRHAIAIALALKPDPAQWKYLGMIEEEGRCVCGARVLYQYVLENKTDERVISIGSTCIEETIPYLRQMDANELAEAIEYGLSQPTRLLLEQSLYLACHLDNWVRTFYHSLSPYFQKFGNQERPWLCEVGRFSDIASRYRALQARLRHFYDRVPIARKAAEGRVDWVDPPQEIKAPEGWLETRLEAEQSWMCLVQAIRTAPKYTDESNALYDLLSIPMSICEMRAWMSRVEKTIAWASERPARMEARRRQEVEARREAQKRREQEQQEIAQHEEQDNALFQQLGQAMMSLGNLPQYSELFAVLSKTSRDFWNLTSASQMRAWRANAQNALRILPSAQKITYERERFEQQQRPVRLRAQKSNLQQELNRLRNLLVSGYEDKTHLILKFESRANPKTGAIELQARIGKTIYVVARSSRKPVREGEAWLCLIGCTLFDGQFKTVRLVEPVDRMKTLQDSIYHAKQKLLGIEVELTSPAQTF